MNCASVLSKFRWDTKVPEGMGDHVDHDFKKKIDKFEDKTVKSRSV